MAMLIESKTIEPNNGGSGIVKAGQVLRIVDVEGQQVGCFVSFRHGEPTEYMDCVYTNWCNRRYKWQEGDTIFSNHMNPLWTIVDDQTSNHYTGGGFCSRDALERFYDTNTPECRHTTGCRDTIQDQYRANAIDPDLLQGISALGLFMSVEYAPSGEWVVSEPITKAGDCLALRAETNVMWAVSVCGWPDVINGDKPTPLRFELYDG